MVTIENQITKKDGQKVLVKATKDDGFAVNIINKFNSTSSASKFTSSINRKQKLQGKRYYIASAMLVKASKENEANLTDKLKEKFNANKI